MSVMKKKKHSGELIGLQILQNLIFGPRRYPRSRRIRHFIRLLSVVSGCILLLFIVLLFLYPPIVNHRGYHPILNPLFNNGDEAHMNFKKESGFRVPPSGGIFERELWTSDRSNLFFGCSNASLYFSTAKDKTERNRYLLIATSGGLNQQRTGIVDAVVAAYILNATLVVPKLDQKSFWKDASKFSEIFDVGWFIKSLSRDVRIVKHLPGEAGKVITTRVPRKCSKKCYEARILPIFEKKRVQAVQLTKFDYRLSNQLDVDLQKLRCRVNYHALKFTDPILEMGRRLVQRMRTKNKHYLALHLRFEPDMLAFSGCYYGGGVKEMKELGVIRKRWKTLHTKNPDKERRHGKCPLSPEEVGLMLRALGYGKNVHIYVASGDIYGGEVTMAPLKALFPNLHTKETIASKEELAEFSPYSSRMAALDFIVSDESDVFVANNNGNMAKILAGKRRYFGHKPTIRPNARKLYRLFLNRDNMTWDEFASRVRTSQIGFMGEPNEVKPGRGEFHEHPLACICENSESRTDNGETAYQSNRASSNNQTDETLLEDEQPLLDTEYNEDDQDLLDTEYAQLK